MSPSRCAAVVLTVLALAAGSAAASVPHTVTVGETLSGVAAVDGIPVATLAAANGLSPQALLVAGSTIQIPPVAPIAPGAPKAAAVGAAASASAPADAAPAATAAAPTLGGYTVRVGDTLSGLAAGARVPLEAIARMNGLDPNGVLLAGTVIKLPTGAPLPARADQPAPAARGVAASPGRVSAADIAQVASRNGVPAPLASAIAWQESGFNNAMVSSANARGVMQVMPGTWDWVQATLAKRQLNPVVPIDNVGAGVLYLGYLLRETGGDSATAAAAYYQGLSSVRHVGMLPETRRYVDNVLALRGRFGG